MFTSIFKKHQTKIIGGGLLVVALIAASYVLNKQGQDTSLSNPKSAISFAKQDQNVQVPAQKAVQAQIHASTKKQVTVIQSIPKLTQKKSDLIIIKPSKLPEIAPEAKILAELTKFQEKQPIQKRHPEKLMHLAQLESIPAIPVEKHYHVDVIKNPKLAKKFDEKVLGNAQTEKAAKTLRAKGLQISKGSDILLKENSNDYTLQVIGLSYEKSMLKFICDNHLQRDTYYVKTKLHGKPWFILVYGIYKTRQEATRAIKNLPPALQKYKPWPRQLKYVKNDILNARAFEH